jgi:hypothetical protein
MFGSLLATLAADATTSIPDLAGRLGTDVRTVRLVLEQCQHLGYLEAVDGGTPAAGNACAGCPIACPVPAGIGAAACAIAPGRPTWWRLTERGERAARLR